MEKRFSFLLMLLIALLSSCRKQPATPTSKVATSPPAVTSATEPLIFSAAASTKDVMEALAAQFKDETGVEVKVNPGPSSGLANQILAGAPADLFLSANREWADEVEKSGQAVAKARLLTNKVVIVVPADNPAQVKEPGDLLSDNVKKIAVAGEKVPAGMYAEQALTKLGLYSKLVDSNKIARGHDVRVTLSYVERGEAEAGIVYSTDVAAATNVTVAHEFDPKLHDEIVYVLVLLKQAEQKASARKFYDFLQSPNAEATYKKHQFTRLTKDN